MAPSDSNPLREIIIDGIPVITAALSDIAAKVLFEEPSEKGADGSRERRKSASAAHPYNVPRRFLLWRHKDHSGVSGTGYVATGVEFPDGTVAVRWFGNDPSTSLWENIGKLEAVHGHNGSTEIEWID